MGKLYILNGPSVGECFEVSDGATYIGRSAENDIQIQDKTVSRRHLRVLKKEKKYFITDLQSRNGTFYNGHYIVPPVELEVKEGVPIAIGMSLICIGETCHEQIMPLLDSIGLTKEDGEQSSIFEVHRSRTIQRKLELLCSVSNTLSETLPLNEILEKVLGDILELFSRIDRGAFVLVDPETEEIVDVISRSCKPNDESFILYSSDVVLGVIEKREPLVILDAQTEKDDKIMDTLKILKIESVMCLPLLSGSQILGALYFDSSGRPYGFSRGDLSLFMDLSKRIAITIENWRFRLELAASPDSLS